MPTYQYSCTECGHSLETVQSFSDDSLTVCPECQGRLRKVFNAVGVVFKGSGFYRNDSRASAATGSSETGGSADGGDGSSGSGKDKPAAKPAAVAEGKGSDKSSAKREGGSASTATPKSA